MLPALFPSPLRLPNVSSNAPWNSIASWYEHLTLLLFWDQTVASQDIRASDSVKHVSPSHT